MTVLKTQFEDVRRKVNAEIPAQLTEAIRSSITAISETGFMEQAVKAGDFAPAFRLSTARGRPCELYDHLSRGPVVLSFYRGEWCPYCALELDALSEIHEQIKALGASLIAISPDPTARPEGAPSRAAPFPLLCDPGAKTARKYGVGFRLPDPLRTLYQDLGLPPAANGVLPIPATYVIDQKGQVVVSYMDPDFTTRLEPSDILVALECLRARKSSPNAQKEQ